MKVTNFTIQRRDVQTALTRTTENRLRMVPVFQSTAPGRAVEHRLFDLNSKSVYALLGLQSADIIVAADGFLVKRPDQFMIFTQLLQGQDQAPIEIRRNGEARLLKYAFVPSVSGPNAAVSR
jgi:type II secretory pathway component PulC